MITPLAPSWPGNTSAGSPLESVSGLVTVYIQRVAPPRSIQISCKKRESQETRTLVDNLGRSIEQVISGWPRDRRGRYARDFAAFNLHSSAIEGVELDEEVLINGLH